MVYRVGKDDVAEAVDVTVGRKVGDTVEIQGALKSGDKVVLDPPAGLASGAKVAVASK